MLPRKYCKCGKEILDREDNMCYDCLLAIQPLLEIADLLNKGNKEGLKEVLDTYKGSYAAKLMLEAVDYLSYSGRQIGIQGAVKILDLD